MTCDWGEAVCGTGPGKPCVLREAWGTRAPPADELTNLAPWAGGTGGLGPGYVKRTLSGPPLPLEASPGACMLGRVCASQWLPLGVAAPAFLSSCTPASTHKCVPPTPHTAVSHQLTQLSPRGRGPFLLRKLSDSLPLCVHTCRGCVTCPRSRGIDAMSFSRRFTGNFLECQEFGGLSSGQRQKGQGDRKINLRQRHSF